MGLFSPCSWVISLLLLERATAEAVCAKHEVDFVMLDGNSMHKAIEKDMADELAKLGITVNAKFLKKEALNAAMKSGDFHMVFSETWGAPYDPVSYMTSWKSNNEAHYSAMSGVTGANSRSNIFSKLDAVLAEEHLDHRKEEWDKLHKMVHQTAVNLPLWGKRIPAVLNKRLAAYTPGYQQFDYPVQTIKVKEGSKKVTIAPGAQTGLFNTVGRLDPHSYRPNEFFANNWVYEGLVSYAADGEIKPALATKWTESKNSVTFTLRSGVKFTDGAAWTCDVAKLNFDHVFAAPLRTGDYHLWYHLPEVIDSWKCDDNDNFVITTKAPSSVLLQELSFIRPHRMLSPKSFKSTAADSWKTHNSCPEGWGTIKGDSVTITCVGITAPVGTGPFKFDSRTQGTEGTGDDKVTFDKQVVFKSNPDWWGGAIDIEELHIKRYTTAAAVAAALKDGSLDMVVGDGVLTPADLKTFMTASNMVVSWTGVMQHSIVIINSGKSPTSDIALRQAIIHGVDKAAIINKELNGIGKAVDRLFPKTAPYSSVELTPWDFDMEKARTMNCPATQVNLSPQQQRMSHALIWGLLSVTLMHQFQF